MPEEEIKKQLEGEGFKNVCVISDTPGKFYPDHVHMAETAHVIISGEMELEWSDGTKKIYKAGDRFDIPKSDVHNATIGKEGCVYVVGDK